MGQYEDMVQIQKKVIQVLRIKTKLDDKKAQLLSALMSPDNLEANFQSPNALLQSLNTLENVCKRERKVLFISIDGLYDAMHILDKNEGEVMFYRSFRERMKYFIKSRLPFNKDITTQVPSLVLCLRFLYKTLYSELERSEKSLKALYLLNKEQNNIIQPINAQISKGIFDFNLIKSQLSELEKLYMEESKIVEKFRKKTKTRKLFVAVNNLNSQIQGWVKKGLSGNKGVKQMQAILIAYPTPTVRATALAGSFFFGFELFSFLYISAQLVRYHSALIAIAKESIQSFNS